MSLPWGYKDALLFHSGEEEEEEERDKHMYQLSPPAHAAWATCRH